jgi:putative glutamine amidotransferase
MNNPECSGIVNAPRIGITTYGIDQQGSYTLPAEYVSATRRAGGIPVLIPPGETRCDLLCEHLDAIILAGGGDLDPATYGGQQHPSVYMVDAHRDTMEIAIARRVIESRLPTLAICRGAQVVNIALGGTLHEHLPDLFGEEVQHRLPPREPTPHRVIVQADSALGRLLGKTEFEAASWHHQAINEIGSQLRVVAHAPDGVVEALEMPSHRWLFAVQWHPEITADTDPIQQRLFDSLVAAAQQK